MKLMTASEAFNMTIRTGLVERIASAIVDAIDNKLFHCYVDLDNISADNVEYIKELLADAKYRYIIHSKDNRLYISWYGAGK